MLSCIYDGKIFTTKQYGFTTDDKYQLGRERKLLCPVCKTSVFFCEDGEKIAHFTHHKVGECPIGNYRSYDYATTEKHDNLVNKFTDWVKAQYPNVEIYPDYYVNNELYTDVYFELGAIKIAVEVQFKSISNPSFIKRRELYKKHNIKDIWFFIRENKEFSIGSPYQRTYYKSNHRELYFYQIEEAICKAYKGFTNEKWEIVGKNTLLKAVSEEVPLENVKIKNDGTLIISELRYKYLQKLKEKREKTSQWRSTQRLYREQQNQESQQKNCYSSKNNFSSFAPRQAYFPFVEYKDISESQFEKITPEVPLLDKIKKYKSAMQDKAYNQEYKEYLFKTENRNDYLYIKIIYQGKEYDVKYLILKKQIERNEIYLTCRKETEAENIRYSINVNPFLDSMKKVRIQRYEMN